MMDRRAFILGGIAAFGAPSAIDAQMVEERRRPIGAMSGNQNAQGAAEREAQPVLALRRGLNLSHWFAQAPRTQGYSQEHLSVHTTASDLTLIRRLGFDHARLSVDPALLFTPAGRPLGGAGGRKTGRRIAAASPNRFRELVVPSLRSNRRR